MVAKLRQRAIRCAAVIAVALGAGQFVQSTSAPAAKPKLASETLSVKPTKLETVAAGSEAIIPAPTPKPEAARSPTAPVITGSLAPVLPKLTLPTAPPAMAKIEPVSPAPKAMLTDVAPENACPTTLDLSLSENAIIGVTLIAKCHPNERVTLKHAGLVVSAQTTLTGAIFADLPALTKSATVEVSFKDGTTISNAIDVPEVANFRRFAVQWQAMDTFLLHGFENGAAYNAAGDVNVANPRRPVSGVPTADGFLTVLGDSATENPLLAEVYTYPADPSIRVDVVIEAPVTEATCAREMLGETLLSLGGTVTTTDLTVAMPDCDAIGDYLVLNNLVPDMSIASSN